MAKQAEWRHEWPLINKTNGWVDFGLPRYCSLRVSVESSDFYVYRIDDGPTQDGIVLMVIGVPIMGRLTLTWIASSMKSTPLTLVQIHRLFNSIHLYIAFSKACWSPTSFPKSIAFWTCMMAFLTPPSLANTLWASNKYYTASSRLVSKRRVM